jgi:hypothetical protein
VKHRAGAYQQSKRQNRPRVERPWNLHPPPCCDNRA